MKVHTTVCLETLVPATNFYRQLEAKLDLSFIDDLVRDCYCWWTGRPSLDPIVFFKLQLIMFFDGIRSERQLMEYVHLNLAYRWYIGYDLDEKVPHHSSLTRLRERFGLAVFQRFFEQIVEQCMAAGLVWGQELYCDGTKVRANAAADTQIPRFAWLAKQHLNGLFEPGPSSEEPTAPASVYHRLVHKYGAKPDLTEFGGKQTDYARLADYQVSPVDPDATPLRPGKESQGRLGYHTHYVVDGGKARIILAVLVTPAAVMDHTPMLDLVHWTRFRWKLRLHMVVGDARYGTMENIIDLEQAGIKAYLASPDYHQRHRVYAASLFQYQPQQDCYICPQGQTLFFSGLDQRKSARIYRAPAKICKRCPVKPDCTTYQYGRVIQRLPFQEILDQAAALRQTEAYRKAMRKRLVWVEPLFAEAKQWHQLARFRLRQLQKVNIIALLTASGQNIKRLLKAHCRYRPFPIHPFLVLPKTKPLPELVVSALRVA